MTQMADLVFSQAKAWRPGHCPTDIKSNEMYPRASHGKGILHAAVWDISAKPSDSTTNASSPSPFVLPENLAPQSVDILTAIFVLSALHPLEWQQAMINIHAALRPGGLLCIRDYGRHDLAQLRMKKERLLDPDWGNLYIRGDGTRVWFFSKEDLEALVGRDEQGLGQYVQGLKGRQEVQRSLDDLAAEDDGRDAEKGRFEITQMSEDRRLVSTLQERADGSWSTGKRGSRCTASGCRSRRQNDHRRHHDIPSSCIAYNHSDDPDQTVCRANPRHGGYSVDADRQPFRQQIQIASPTCRL